MSLLFFFSFFFFLEVHWAEFCIQLYEEPVHTVSMQSVDSFPPPALSARSYFTLSCLSTPLSLFFLLKAFFLLLLIFGKAICSQQGAWASKILLLMTLNGVIIQMKGNYPNLTLPSALQYLWVLFISCSTHCSHFNISGYSSCPPLDSTCALFSCPSSCSS